MACRNVRGLEHEQLVKLIHSVLGSDSEDSGSEDIQELEDDNFSEKKKS